MNRRQALKYLASLPLVASMMIVCKKLPSQGGSFKSEQVPFMELPDVADISWDLAVDEKDVSVISQWVTVTNNDKPYYISLYNFEDSSN